MKRFFSRFTWMAPTLAVSSASLWAQGASTPTAPAHAGMAAPATTTAATTATDIRDIRGPLPIPSSEIWFMWILGILLLAALLYGAWRWYRHVKSTPKLPYEIALERLEKARALMQLDRARDFSIEVSEIVRRYIEARFHVQAAHQTTEEFLYNLLEPSDALLARHRELLADFLQHCDLAKFARWVLSIEEMEGMHASARAFVLETGKPQATPAPTAPVSTASAAPSTVTASAL